MKKLLLFAIPLLILPVLFQNSYAASSYRTYEVVDIRSDGIVVKGLQGGTYLIDKDPGGLQKGDLVRYDSGRHRLKKYSWQSAKITGMTDGTVTLQLNNGENVEIPMRSRYRDEFAAGDRVYYKAESGQIKKGGFPQTEEEPRD